MTTQNITLASIVGTFNTDANNQATQLRALNIARGTPVAGQVPVYQLDGTVSWATAGVIPSGSQGNLQFNNGGVLGASASLTWDGTKLNTNTITSLTGNNLGLQSPTQIIEIGSSQANFVRVLGVAAGSVPLIFSAGSDTNINLALGGKGFGGVQLGQLNDPTPLLVADSPTHGTFTEGSLGNVLTSAGANKTPYWSNSVALTSGTVANTPLNQTDIARLQDLQFAAAGLSPQNPAGILVHIAKFAISGTYTNNTGAGTATFTSSTQLTVAGLTPSAGDIVLMVAQANAIQNGPYTVNSNSVTGFTMTRTNAIPRYGNFWVVTAPFATNYGEQWQNTTINNIVIGTTDINYTVFGVLTLPNLEQVTTLGNSTTKGLVLANNSFLQLNDAQSSPNRIQLYAPTTLSANYVLRLPVNQGTANQTLSNDGSGNLSWASLVTSVGLALPSPFNVANSPITSSGTITATWGTGQIPVANLGSGTASSSTYLRGDGTWAPAVGGVSSVALTAPSPFTVTGSPVTSTGTLALAWGTGQIPTLNLGTGTANATSYLRGDSTWVQPRLDGLGDVAVDTSYTYTSTTYIVQSFNDTNSTVTLTLVPPVGTFVVGDLIKGSLSSLPTGIPVRINTVAGAVLTLDGTPSTFGFAVGNTVYKGTSATAAGSPLIWNQAVGKWVSGTNVGGLGIWQAGAGTPTTITGATLGNYYWNTTNNTASLMTALTSGVQTWTAQPNLDGYVTANSKTAVKAQTLSTAITSSYVQLRFTAGGDTTPFATQLIAAGSGLAWDLTSTYPKLNSTVATGLGWVVSIFASFRTTTGSPPGWTTGGAAVPRFTIAGTVVTDNTFVVGARAWSTSSAIDNINFIATAYKNWNNSFADALTILTAQAEDTSRFTLETAVLPAGVTPTQTDAQVKALFNVGNPTLTDAISSFVYDDNGGLYEYQRAAPFGLQIGLQTVLQYGSTASRNLTIASDLTPSPTSRSVIAPTFITSPNIHTSGPNVVNYVSLSSGATGIIPLIKSAGTSGIALQVRGGDNGGNLILGVEGSNAGLTLVNSATSSVLQATGNGANISTSLLSKGTGTVSLGGQEGTASSIVVNGNSNSTVAITANSSASVTNLTISQKGTGTITIGRTDTSALQILGPNNQNMAITTAGAYTDINLYVGTKGAGTIFLSNTTYLTGVLGSGITVANQPVLYVASGLGSQTPGAGALGQAILSAGAAGSGSPYWGNPLRPNTSIFQLAIGKAWSVAAGTFACGESTSTTNINIAWTTTTNPLNLTLDATAGSISNFQAGVRYRVDLMAYFGNYYGGAFVAYFSLTTTNTIITATSIANGASLTMSRSAESRGNDAVSRSSMGYFVAPGTQSPLYAWSYMDASGANPGGTALLYGNTATIFITITKID